jgi:lipoprotein-anchoring transpeptidase ErfK/SrfK
VQSEQTKKKSWHRHPADEGSGTGFQPMKSHRQDADATRSTCHIDISIRDQRLTLKQGDEMLRSYPISTSRFGVGTEEGSMKTPTGRFRIVEKIGEDMPMGTVFRSRVALGPHDPLPPTEDLVMSRILWLAGCEEHNANTRDRFIYIHGTKHEDKIGSPASHGCIRMRNADVIELFELVDKTTSVVIRE